MEWSQVLSKNVKCFFYTRWQRYWRNPRKYPYIKRTLHLRNNIALNDSLDPPKFRVYNKNSKFDILHAEKSANIFANKKIIFKGSLHFRNNIALKDSLDPMNNKFIIKIRNSHPSCWKIRKYFCKKKK